MVEEPTKVVIEAFIDEPSDSSAAVIDDSYQGGVRKSQRVRIFEGLCAIDQFAVSESLTTNTDTDGAREDENMVLKLTTSSCIGIEKFGSNN